MSDRAEAFTMYLALKEQRHRHQQEEWQTRAERAEGLLDEAVGFLREWLRLIEPYGVGTDDLGPCMSYYHVGKDVRAFLAALDGTKP